MAESYTLDCKNAIFKPRLGRGAEKKKIPFTNDFEDIRSFGESILQKKESPLKKNAAV